MKNICIGIIVKKRVYIKHPKKEIIVKIIDYYVARKIQQELELFHWNE